MFVAGAAQAAAQSSARPESPPSATSGGAQTPVNAAPEAQADASVRANGTRPTLTLDAALQTAAQNQPQIRRAQAAKEQAGARVDQAKSGYLPQVNAQAAYTLGYGGRVVSGTGTPFDWSRGFNASLNANQLIWDFGRTTSQIDAARANLAASGHDQTATVKDVQFNVRTSYFQALASRALVDVARESLANQDRHLQQIQAFVEVGTRPEIDLAQVRTDRANAEVSLISAENGYETAKAVLNQAMGVEGSTDYDLADVAPTPIEGEAEDTDALMAEAAKNRPELASLEEQARAQGYNISSTEARYYPSFVANAGVSDNGRDYAQQNYGATAGVGLSWTLFNGFDTRAQVQEARAALRSIEAQRDQIRQQIRLEVDRARLAVRAAIASLKASQEAETNARTRLELAEGRYQAGVGNIIELGDAQVALTQSEAQRVQAAYNVSQARAQLINALGR